MMIRQILITLALLFAAEPLTLVAQSPVKTTDPWVFAYFHEPADQGIYLALS